MKTAMTVRIETELLAQTRRCAREESRTRTNFIETILQQRIATPSLAEPLLRVERTFSAEGAKDKAAYVT